MQNTGNIVIDTTLGDKLIIFCYTGRRVNDNTYWNGGLALQHWANDNAQGWGFINCGYNFNTTSTYFANGNNSLSAGPISNGVVTIGTAVKNYWMRWYAVG